MLTMNPQNNQQPQQFGYPTAPNPYQMPQSTDHKKQLFLMIGGGVLILILLLWVVFGGKSTPGQTEMRKAAQETSESLGILDEFQEEVTVGATKSDLALAQILLRSNSENLNDLYNKTYKPKRRLSNSPKPDEASVTKLEAAQRSNLLDTEIIVVLQPKIAAARLALEQSKPNFSKKESLQQLEKAQADLQAIAEILEQPR